MLPTPAVSSLLRQQSCAAGVVISASHNPADDNGIKIVGSGGQKIDDGVELSLERRLGTGRPTQRPSLPDLDPTLADRYMAQLIASHDCSRPLDGMHVVLDCANGAASTIGPTFLERLGARITAIAAAPDGRNINRDCGATAPQGLVERVLQERADAGVAVDGDADRAILVDERGQLLDGDDILLAWARHLLAHDRLPGRRLIATVMSNFGLERSLRADGMTMTRCPVGDRSVWLAMGEHGAALGGEQSGHVICSHHSVTGDGLLTGSHLLAIARSSLCAVSELSDLVRTPQLLVNVPVARRRPFNEIPRVADELAEVERRLEGRGRVLLRYSGTEPLARVMVEGDDAQEIDGLAKRLADAVKQELG